MEILRIALPGAKTEAALQAEDALQANAAFQLESASRPQPAQPAGPANPDLASQPGAGFQEQAALLNQAAHPPLPGETPNPLPQHQDLPARPPRAPRLPARPATCIATFNICARIVRSCAHTSMQLTRAGATAHTTAEQAGLSHPMRADILDILHNAVRESDRPRERQPALMNTLDIMVTEDLGRSPHLNAAELVVGLARHFHLPLNPPASLASPPDPPPATDPHPPPDDPDGTFQDNVTQLYPEPASAAGD